MTVCQFFRQGRCRFGQNCKFEHSYNTDDSNNRNTGNTQQLSNVVRQIVCEVILAEKGGQWPLSCFSPVKEGTNIPGFEDVSPEEVRWKMYEARAKGNLNQAINEINQLYSNAEKMRNLLKQPTMERVNLIVNALKGKKDTPNTSNPFASSTSSSGIFSSSSTQNNIFGNTTQNTSNIFGGSQQASSTQGNIFGGVSSNYSNQNIFGGSSSSAPFKQNIFAQPQNQNIFASPTPTASGNLFSSTTNQNVFSNAASSSNQSTVPNAFGSSNSTVFQNQGASSPIFSGQNNFFQSSSNTTANAFGGSQTENVFKNQSVFGGSSTINNQQQGGSVFGGQTQPGFTVSQTKPNALDPSIYSKVEDLSEEDIKLFTAPTFTFGKIPLKPPAQEYC